MKDVIKLSLGLGVGISGILLAKYHPPTIDTINEVKGIVDNLVGLEIRELIQKTTIPAASIVAGILWQKRKEEKIKIKRGFDLNNLNHGKSFSTTTLDIREGRLYIENQMEYNIDALFSGMHAVSDVIIESGNKLNYSDGSIIINFENESGKQVYSKIRDNPKIFPEDKLERIANFDHGIHKKETQFIAILTRTPKYKTFEDGSIQIVDKNEENPETAEKVRLMTVRRKILDQVLAWCKHQKNEGECFCEKSMLDAICKDEGGNEPCVDKYIRDMLKENYKLIENPDIAANDLLRDPLHRKYMVAIAQMARHLRDGGGKLKVYKEVECN